MKIKEITFFLILICCFHYNYSQNIGLSSLLIPDSLKVHANAVIRNETTEITIKAANKLVVKKRRVITILNKLGNRHADLYQGYDKDSKINKLSAKIYDVLGNEIKKFSENKFTDVSATDGFSLYSDAKVKYIDYTPTSYPYTILFESEIENSTTGFIHSWVPIDAYSLSVQKSTYKVYNPLGLVYRKKENNFKDFPIKELSKNDVIHYELINQPAKKYERNGLAFFKVMPILQVALNDFTLKNVSGTAANWKDFGSWMQEKLLKDRISLKEETKSEIRTLVKEANANTIREKARVVYNYMQNKTRYISVQVGIGGWQPISAQEVDKMGYGDCKGLSNYTKALLNAVDVPSNYTIVYADSRRDIDPDFTSIQGNHAMLHVPDGEKDVWLECTSQLLPFDFLGKFTEDRSVLVVTPEGGVIKRTPAYENETNLQTTSATVVLDEAGNITGSVKRISKGIQYDDKFRKESKSKEELKKYYLKDVWSYNNNLEIESIDIENNKEEVVYTEKFEVKIDKYATINETEYLFRTNVFNKFSHIPKRYRNRKLSLEIDWGFLDKDEFIIKIPKDYRIQGLPEIKKITNKFGEYKVSIEKKDEETLIYKKYFLLKKGVHPKEEYKNYRNFLKTVAKYENLRIALSKK